MVPAEADDANLEHRASEATRAEAARSGSGARSGAAGAAGAAERDDHRLRLFGWFGCSGPAFFGCFAFGAMIDDTTSQPNPTTQMAIGCFTSACFLSDSCDSLCPTIVRGATPPRTWGIRRGSRSLASSYVLAPSMLTPTVLHHHQPHHREHLHGRNSPWQCDWLVMAMRLVSSRWLSSHWSKCG